MKRLLPALFLAAFSLHAAPEAAPSPPPTPQSVERLATLAQVDKIHDSMLTQLQQSMDSYVKQAARGQALTPADQKLLDDFKPKMIAMVDEQLSGAKIKAMYEEVYAEMYSQEEVDGLIAFYGTPVGQVFAEKQPLVSTKMGLLISQRAGQMGMRLQMAMISTARKIAEAHKPPPPPKPAAPAAKPAAAVPAAAPSSAKGN